jgi:septal ring factor EnvC (AmiA/AmiB activator)
VVHTLGVGRQKWQLACAHRQVAASLASKTSRLEDAERQNAQLTATVEDLRSGNASLTAAIAATVPRLEELQAANASPASR